MSHATDEAVDQEAARRIRTLYAHTRDPATARSRSDIAAFFEGLSWVEPGLVFAPQWRPEGSGDILFDEPEPSAVLAAVGYKT